MAGNIDTIVVANIEHIEISIIDFTFISDGILLRKYISSGNNDILKIWLRSILIFSIYTENNTPIIIPIAVATVPIENPTKKKNLSYWFIKYTYWLKDSDFFSFVFN